MVRKADSKASAEEHTEGCERIAVAAVGEVSFATETCFYEGAHDHILKHIVGTMEHTPSDDSESIRKV